MIFSCVAAFVLPFELFLFSYAVLGPLHYLTEISWLHKRQYFSSGKYDYIFLVVLAVVLFFMNTGRVQPCYFLWLSCSRYQECCSRIFCISSFLFAVPFYWERSFKRHQIGRAHV